MNNPKHILTDKDLEAKTGTCQVCGPVDITRINRGGRCGNAVRLQKGKNHVYSYISEHQGTVYLSKEARAAILDLYGTNCNICNTEFDENTIPHLDHSHYSGIWRGALCKDCNTGIGALKDNEKIMRAAITYIRRGLEEEEKYFERVELRRGTQPHIL